MFFGDDEKGETTWRKIALNCARSADAICFNCKWECYPVQDEEPDYTGGANRMSLNQAREAYKKRKPVR